MSTSQEVRVGGGGALAFLLLGAGCLAIYLLRPGTIVCGRTKRAVLESDLSAIGMHVQAYQRDNQSRLPGSWDELNAYLDTDFWFGDPWGREYILVFDPSVKDQFDILSFGSGGRPGGTGEREDSSFRKLQKRHRVRRKNFGP